MNSHLRATTTDDVDADVDEAAQDADDDDVDGGDVDDDVDGDVSADENEEMPDEWEVECPERPEVAAADVRGSGLMASTTVPGNESPRS